MPFDDVTSPGFPQPAYGVANELFPAVPPQAPAAAYEMRPLSVGEILDRTFALYRSRFWLFAGIAAISGAIQMVLSFVQMFTTKVQLGVPASPLEAFSNSGLAFVFSILFFLVYSVTQAATVHAVSESYLGRTTTVTASMSATMNKWYRYMAVAVWQVWSMVWVAVVVAVPAMVLIAKGSPIAGGALAFVGIFGGMIYGAIAYLRNSLAIQACVMEALPIRPSMRRSKVLTVGAKGRIFVVGLVMFCLLMVAGVIEAPLLFFIARAPGEKHIAVQSVMLIVNFVAHVVVTPIGLIGLSLLYFDQRVRREGFDLLLLLGPEAAPVMPAPGIVPAETVAAEGSFQG